MERTFSCQKHLDTALRNRMNQGIAHSLLFVKFNFSTFGDQKYIPEEERIVPRFLHSSLPKKAEDGLLEEACCIVDIFTI